MPLGTFTLTIDGERQDGTAETKAKLHLRTQGVDTLIDADADEFKFPTQFADGRGQTIPMPYTLTLFTDTAAGEGESTTIGYEGWVRTDQGRVDFQIAAQEAGATVSLTDLVDTVVVPVSTAQGYVADAEAARDEAVAALTNVQRSVNVKEYGATGLGVVDDGPAIQAALDALKPLAGTMWQKSLYLPEGTYLTNQPLVSNAGIKIWGANEAGVRIKVGPSFPAGGSLLKFTKDGTSPLTLENHVGGLEISGLTLDGNLRSVQANAIELYRFDRAHIDVRVNAFRGTALLATHSVRESQIRMRTWLCGDVDHPVLDINQTDATVSEGANLMHFTQCVFVLNMGDQARVRSAAGVVARVLHFNQCVFHGLNEWIDEYFDMYGDALTLNHEGNMPCRFVVDNARSIVLDNCRLHLAGRGQPLLYLTDKTAGATTVNSLLVNGSVLGFRSGAYTARNLSVVDAAADTLQLSGVTTNRHHLQTGSRIQVAAITLPAPLPLPDGITAATDYYAIKVSDTVFKLATSRANALAGTAIDITSTGSGSVTQYDTYISAVDVGTDTLTAVDHRLTTGARFRVATDGGSLPTGLAASTDYYVIRVDKDNFKLAASLAEADAGTAVNITATGSNVYVTPQDFVGVVQSGTLEFDGNVVDGTAPTRGYFRVLTGAALRTGLTNIWSTGATTPAAEYQSGAQHDYRVDGALTMLRNNHPVTMTRSDGTTVQVAKVTAGNVVTFGALTGTDNLELMSVGGLALLKVGGNEKFRAQAGAISFNGSAAISKPTITGSRGGNAALADLLTKLASYGLITDGTTA